MYFINGQRLTYCKKNPKQSVSECQHLSGDHTGTKNWFTQLIFSTHSPRRNIISGVKKWIGVQNRERERKKDSSHFKTFFTCEAVVSNPLCLTIFHLHWWVKKKKLEFVVLFRKLIFKQAPVNSPCCSVFVWERLGAYLFLQRTTDRATPSQ